MNAATGMVPVALKVTTRDGTVVPIHVAGLVITAAPGLLVTPWYTPQGAVRGRFTLTHAGSGRSVAPVPMCSHDARRWAIAAGWIGVDWRAHEDVIMDSWVARVFAWRLADEWRAHCDECPPVEPLDTRTAGTAWR